MLQLLITNGREVGRVVGMGIETGDKRYFHIPVTEDIREGVRTLSAYVHLKVPPKVLFHDDPEEQGLIPGRVEFSMLTW